MPTTTTRKKSAAKRGSATPPARRWSQRVTEHSDAMDLEPHVFERGSARAIAQSVHRSAARSPRRKSSPYRSAMSMLTFYVNRAGRNLSPARKRVLERAKDELRALYGSDESASASTRPKRARKPAARKTRAPAKRKTTTRPARPA